MKIKLTEARARQIIREELALNERNIKSWMSDRRYKKEKAGQAREVLKLMADKKLSDDNVRTWLDQWILDDNKKILDAAIKVIKKNYPKIADEFND